MKRKINQNWPRTDTIIRIFNNIKTVITTVFHIFKELGRDMQDFVHSQTELRVKTTIYEVKNMLSDINDRQYRSLVTLKV